MNVMPQAVDGRNTHDGLEDLPLFSFRPSNQNHNNGTLTLGGALVFRRIRRAPATCNVIAALAGIGEER
jgi:hypothetical protein